MVSHRRVLNQFPNEHLWEDRCHFYIILVLRTSFYLQNSNKILLMYVTFLSSSSRLQRGHGSWAGIATNNFTVIVWWATVCWDSAAFKIRNANYMLMRFPKASCRYLPASAIQLTSVCSITGPEVAPSVLVNKETWKEPMHNGGKRVFDASGELVGSWW